MAGADTELKITVPGEPVPLQRPRKGQHGNFYTPRESTAYEHAVAWAARAEGVRFGQADVVVWTDFYCGNGKIKDGDNCHKAALDALQKAGVYANDSQVVEGHWRLLRNELHPRTEILVVLFDDSAT